MLDVRNAISNILDRYTLADVVDVTMRKLRKNKAPLRFALEPLLSQTASGSKATKRPKSVNGQTPAEKASS